jgi:hypothetical protein
MGQKYGRSIFFFSFLHIPDRDEPSDEVDSWKRYEHQMLKLKREWIDILCPCLPYAVVCKPPQGSTRGMIHP